jgi:hypothetical protein
MTFEYLFDPANHRTPYGSIVALVIGFLGLQWSWLNLRNNQRVISSFFIFLVSIVVLFGSLLIVLPWSAGT